tara:strand:+ start:5 stop:661 length:657 start_codon:yes stop_codon:yes gene_type:complete
METMKVLYILLLTSLIFGCAAKIPKEVVELSYQMEKDLVEIESTYVLLVKQHFTLLKGQREDYLNNEWTPKLIESWILDGKLIEMSNGSVFYDESNDEFISVSTPKRSEQLRGITLWADAAVSQIEEKRLELIAPLEKSEQELLEDIQSSFSLLRIGNQTISAHLNSIREVQDVQNELLERNGWNGLRSNISEKLSELSKEAGNGLEKIRELDNKITK